MATAVKKNWIKKIFITGLIMLIASAGVVWYLLTETHADTATAKSAFTVPSSQLISEFKTNLTTANKRYAEQIVTVTGRVSAIETADTTVNIKMTEASTGSYAIFAFQAKDMNRAKQVKEGDSVSIKGSCSGGEYSNILEVHFINFKRCTIN